MDNAIGPYWDCDCFTDGEDEDKRRVVRASAYDAAEVRIRELEEKLRLTEGAFKNTRIRELEAKLAQASSSANSAFVNGHRICELEAVLRTVKSLINGPKVGTPEYSAMLHINAALNREGEHG